VQNYVEENEPEKEEEEKMDSTLNDPTLSHPSYLLFKRMGEELRRLSREGKAPAQLRGYLDKNNLSQEPRYIFEEQLPN